MTDVKVHDKIFTTFISAEKIQSRVAELGIAIDKDYSGKNPLLIGVLNGSVIFMADLLRNIKTPCEIGFIRVSSYEGTSSSGKVKSIMGLENDIQGREVIIVEDIIDTGDTALYLIEEIKKKNPASIRFATILLKPEALRHKIQCDYVGFEIPPAFVVGYGLDYDGFGRNLADIYQLKS
ncbi:MAG: hypoxanthine phosphoribosyltransferase [Bacteroidia bacterium]|jgi:hypoxanthine phosphoribosyltransferase|nr:hypoxanthine phosphoribosyltransferase [Bacteroidota bacterium]MBP6512296.1 hypoxanthine phosphoribosyltransferase [Bacteroidia bacterium]MBP7245333.1 hypoxanthine phosphoribosyltransferase [Bacteroidia bacterium]